MPPRSPRHPASLDFVLYVSASSQSSARALANLRRILRAYKPGQVSVEVCDLLADPQRAEDAQIAFTPTLCKRAPEPAMWILGDLAQPAPLIDLLEFHGVVPTHGNRKAHDRHPRF